MREGLSYQSAKWPKCTINRHVHIPGRERGRDICINLPTH